jgi:hypothetical protein
MYNNIKNFINPKYATFFLVCITCVLLVIFMKSRTTIEGVTNKQIKSEIKTETNKLRAADAKQQGEISGLKTNDKTQDSNISGLKTNDKTQDSNISGLIANDANQDKNISGLQSQANSLGTEITTITGGLSGLKTTIDSKQMPSQTEIEKIVVDKLPSQLDAPIKALNDKIAAINPTINDFNSKLASTQVEMDSKKNDFSKNVDDAKTDLLSTMDKTKKEISDNLYSQYTMYKTDLQNDIKIAKDTINSAKTEVISTKVDAIAAKDGAQTYADKTQNIYDQVFGKSTFNAVQNSLNQIPTKDTAFTTMFSESSFVPNTGYYETFVQREGFETPDFIGSQSQNIVALENDLFSKINDYNTKYDTYSRAKLQAATDAVNAANMQAVNNAATAVTNAATALQTAYPQAGTTDATFKTNHAEILEKSKNIDKLRRDLDTKMTDIIKGKSSPPNDFTQQYDSTVYTGIMWSILGTSTLYYIFTEL